MQPQSPSPAFEHHRAAARERLRRSDYVRAGAGSVTWKINREVVVVAGWGRAILLQLAHPSVAAGVHQHSAFRGSLRASVRRLHSTVGTMLSMTFGNTEQMIAAAARVNAIHDRVQGRDDASRTYSAHDPELQRWVHATLLDSMPLIYERLVGPLTRRERDQYSAESRIMEPLMGMPDGWLPSNAAELDTCMGDMFASDRLVVTDTSRALAHALLYPPKWQMAWPAFRAMQLMTIGSLPPSIRDAYGFTWTARDERALARWTAVLRTSLRIMPTPAREWRMARLVKVDV